ncbi:MAG: HAD-IA family hydrolase [Cellvibrionaceae bacterium]|nr:HAD-IA family hydrolase [Cellvibrionaceae bacterium]
MTLKAVFFDLDGTLLDSAPDFIAAIDQLSERYQLPAIAAERIRQQVSQGGRALTQLTFGMDPTDPDFAARHQQLLDTYQHTLGKHCRLFDGIASLLKQLHAHHLDWGIITNKPARFAEPLLAQLALPIPPKLLLCPDHVSRAKPAPDALWLAARQLQCDPGDLIYIGDHQRDIDCGIAAGATTIAVAYGYLSADDIIEHWHADFIAQQVTDLWPIIHRCLQMQTNDRHSSRC